MKQRFAFYLGAAADGLETEGDHREGPQRGAVDPETVERAKRGDRQAMEVLLGLLGPRLLRVAERLTCDPMLAEELVTEALYRGAVKLRKLRDPMAAGAWFRRILVRLWQDGLRRDQRRARTTAPAAEPEAPLAFDPPALAAESELRAALARALARLPPLQRAVLTLSIDEGLAVAEIAEILGSTPERVKANLWHGRNRLRLLLESFGESPGKSAT